MLELVARPSLKRRAATGGIHVFTNLVGVGNVEVNAFQRLSNVVIQKSVREGFGLVVSEALWKGTRGYSRASSTARPTASALSAATCSSHRRRATTSVPARAAPGNPAPGGAEARSCEESQSLSGPLSPMPQ